MIPFELCWNASAREARDDESFSRKNFEFAMLITSNHKSIRTHRSWFVLLKRQRFFSQVDTSDKTLSRSFDIGSKIKGSKRISTL